MKRKNNSSSEPNSNDSDNPKNFKKVRLTIDPKPPMTYINREINDIDDLIYIGEQYRPGNVYNINVEKLYRLIPVLTKLKNVIGMENVKKTIVNQIIYFIQDFQDKNSDMLHTVIQGPPGVGKTMLGEIIGEIYHKLDIIQQPSKTKSRSKNSKSSRSDKCCDKDDDDENDDIFKDIDDEIEELEEEKIKFIIAKRSDLIGKYLGHTAAKTQEVINKSLGGVLFIDEAYSLGNPEGRDSFSKECIDTINQNLTEKKNQLLVIIAGYKDSLDSCFFAYNDGLRRRFPFVYTIDKYDYEDLSKILVKMVGTLGTDWSVSIEKTELDNIFKTNIDLFSNYAGDVETLLFNIKMEHSKRVFCCPPGSEMRKKINKIDILNAIETYKTIKDKKDKKMSLPDSVAHMYI